MNTPKVHLSYSARSWPACGAMPEAFHWTNDPEQVTCGNCRRTYQWRRAAEFAGWIAEEADSGGGE